LSLLVFCGSLRGGGRGRPALNIILGGGGGGGGNDEIESLNDQLRQSTEKNLLLANQVCMREREFVFV